MIVLSQVPKHWTEDKDLAIRKWTSSSAMVILICILNVKVIWFCFFFNLVDFPFTFHSCNLPDGLFPNFTTH